MAETAMKARPPARKGPVARQSPVRRAHAAVARRHGRAAAPGLLGLPADVEHEIEQDEPQDDGSREDARAERSQGDGPRQGRTGRGRGRRGSAENAAGRGGGGRGSQTGTGKGGRGASTPKAAARSGKATSKPSGRRSASRAAAESSGAKTASRSASSNGGHARKPASAKKSGRTGATKSGARPAAAKASSQGRAKSGPSTSSSSGAEPRGAAGKAGKAMAGKAGKAMAKRTVKKASPGHDPAGAPLSHMARRALGVAARKATGAGAQAARRLVTRAGSSGAEAMLAHGRQLPIQRSVDVAVPLEVAWDEWMKFDYFPEGAHRVEEVQRDGDRLHGQLGGPLATEWEAEVIEERTDESFAWRSTDGSDCVGLITFHRLGDRLTRIELNLDVRPAHVAEALSLALHLADRRAGADLRRFKAHVELISPDAYEDVGHSRGDQDGDSEQYEADDDELDDGQYDAEADER